MGSVKSPAQASKAAFCDRGDARAAGAFRAPSAAGIVLTDVGFHVVYANGVALQILTHPRGPGQMDRSLVQERLKAAFSTERFSSGLSTAQFISGRRRYSCRPFLLDFADDGSDMVALVLERHDRGGPDVGDLAQRFRLSPRECETVGYLVQGLTTKEVAARMGVSPNTIKQFVRLVMSKMGVTTRSGIVGRLIGH
jgi:DNA-binding CsgD family transcriptional regulator